MIKCILFLSANISSFPEHILKGKVGKETFTILTSNQKSLFVLSSPPHASICSLATYFLLIHTGVWAKESRNLALFVQTAWMNKVGLAAHQGLRMKHGLNKGWEGFTTPVPWPGHPVSPLGIPYLNPLPQNYLQTQTSKEAENLERYCSTNKGTGIWGKAHPGWNSISWGSCDIRDITQALSIGPLLYCNVEKNTDSCLS